MNTIPEKLLGVAGLLTTVAPYTSAVYFLCKGNELLYVGSSSQPLARLCGHRNKGFTKAFFLPTPRSLRKQRERELIRALKPTLNVRHATTMATVTVIVSRAIADQFRQLVFASGRTEAQTFTELIERATR